MKSVQLLLLSLLSFLCLSCIDLGSVSTGENLLRFCYTPPEAIIGTEELAFMKGDTVWVPGRKPASIVSSSFGFADPVLTFRDRMCQDSSRELSIIGNLIVEDSCQNIDHVFILNITNSDDSTLASLGLDSEIQFRELNTVSQGSLVRFPEFKIDTTQSHTLEIYEYDLETGDVAGSFAFSAVNQVSGDTIHLKDGIFDGNIYD